MRKGIALCILAVLLISLPGFADMVQVLAIKRGKVVVNINNLEGQIMAPNSVIDGVRFVRAFGNDAEFVIQGDLYSLPIGELAVIVKKRAVMQRPVAPKVVQIRENLKGQYLVDGTINGIPVRFHVDTGANTVAMSPAEAGRIGISFWNGRRGVGGTASGKVESFTGNCGDITVGLIHVPNVVCTVLVSSDSGVLSDAALLGMSFLRHVKMKQENGTLTLSQD